MATVVESTESNDINLSVFDKTLQTDKPKKLQIECSLNNQEIENVIAVIVNIIKQHPEFMIKNYNGRENQTLLKNELREKIFILVDTLEETFNKKEVIKSGIRGALGLKESDIILIKSDSIFIKLFEIPTQDKNIHKKDVVHERYNGIDQSELLPFYQENFTASKKKEFFKQTAKIFLDKYFLTGRIDNYDYEQNVLVYLQSIITQQLLEEFDSNKEFFKGFAGFIFRLHLKEVFNNIAELMLMEVVTSNSYVVNFLKYYSLDVVVADGIRYKVPNLLNDNGLKWNVTSMFSIVKLYIKAREINEELNVEKTKKEIEIKKLYLDDISPLEHNRRLNIEKERLSGAHIEIHNKLDKTYLLFRELKEGQEKETLRREIVLLKKEMQTISDDRKIVLDKFIDVSITNTYSILQKDVDFSFRLIQKHERIMTQKEDDFQALKNALIKALISKKQPI